MAANSTILRVADRARSFSSIRRGLKAGIIVFNKSPTATTPAASSPPPRDVPGLSAQVVRVPPEPVGPGATKAGEYKNPEYFCYDSTSYFEAEIEMLKYRLPQPSSNAGK